MLKAYQWSLRLKYRPFLFFWGLGICSQKATLERSKKGFFSDIDIPQVGAVLDGIVSVLLSKPLLA